MMNKKKGLLIVISGPSGAGKGTICKALLEKRKDLSLSVSATTRAPREGEKDGVNYHFLTREDFQQRIADGKFIEYAEYCQNFYGTLSSEVDGRLEKGLNVILEIEPQGAMKIREKRPDALFIFIVPPSVGELRRRLKKRGTETDEVIEERISKAAWEISQAEKYDYIIVNDALEDAVSDFFAVIRGEQLKKEFSGDIIEEVLKNA